MRKKLNKGEAHQLAVKLTGAKWLKLRNTKGEAGQLCELEIYRGVGHSDVFRGRGWRNTLNNAGLFWE